MLSLAASLTQKWKQMVTFTSRLKMLPEMESELLAPKSQLAQNGVRFGKQYSVGQRRNFQALSREQIVAHNCVNRADSVFPIHFLPFFIGSPAV